MKNNNADALKRGVLVFVFLAVLTALEYLAATNGLPNILLWIAALLKAGAVLWFFMHIKRVFSPDEGDHE